MNQNMNQNIGSVDSRSMKFSWPVTGTISSLFGIRNLKNRTRMHSGIDIAASKGTKIRSVSSGSVLFVGKLQGYGNTIILKHDLNYETLYAHLSKIIVKKGQFIKSNQIIGYVGDSGDVTGPHLHFEIRDFGKQKDPISYLPYICSNNLKVGMQTPIQEQGIRYC